MKTIWKFEIEIQGEQEIEVPAGATILSVGNQNEKLCLWAEVDSTRDKAVRKIEIFGTGTPIPEEGVREFLGTVMFMNSIYVFHIYERIC